MQNIKVNKMIKQEDVDEVILRNAKNKLDICSDCKQRTLEITNACDGGYRYNCIFCGYTDNSSWSSPIYGKYHEKGGVKI